MNKILTFFIIFILSFPVYAKVSSKDINFPGKFYTKEIQSCSILPPYYLSSKRIEDKIRSLIGYDWPNDWKKNSNSMNVIHGGITEPMNFFYVATYNALINKDENDILKAKKILLDFAQNEILYDSIGFNAVKKKPRCWKNNDPNSPCWYHQYEFAKDVLANYILVAILLKDQLSSKEFEIVDKYITKFYKKFLKPQLNRKHEKGFFAMANGLTGILIYSSWKEDDKLAAKTINKVFNMIDDLFYEDGYINNNSFRGYRGQWYHSYGLNSALGFVYVAKLWGADVPDNIQKKLIKSSEVANLAILDWEKFKERKYTGGENLNKISDPKNAIKHSHQEAYSLSKLMELVTNIKLEKDIAYLYKMRANQDYNGLDRLVGFNANCIK